MKFWRSFEHGMEFPWGGVGDDVQLVSKTMNLHDVM